MRFLLEAVGYELGPQQGYGILGSAALLVVAAVVVLFWPLIRSAWSWLRRGTELHEPQIAQEQTVEKARKIEQERDELRTENEELVAERAGGREVGEQVFTGPQPGIGTGSKPFPPEICR